MENIRRAESLNGNPLFFKVSVWRRVRGDALEVHLLEISRMRGAQLKQTKYFSLI